MSTEIENIRKREDRWTLCLTLYKWGESGVSEQSIKAVFAKMHRNLSDTEIRELINYLKRLDFCDTEILPNGDVFAVRTNKLIDLVEYNIETPVSIARPISKYW
jgi:hypothetical protein